jgi:peptidoglycan/LPS O-acetylase OafA/YrhL
VDLFFVLSGYLIGGQLLAPLARGRNAKLRRFFARRALRILPAYLVVLAIYFLLPAWREYPEIFPFWKFLLSVQNIGLRGGTAFSHAWSLAVEDQFYLLLPFILLFVSRWRGAGLLVPGLIVLGGLALRTFLAFHNLTETGVTFRGYQTWIYYATWTRLDPLVFGVTLAAIEKFRPRWWTTITNFAPWLWLPALVAIACGLYLGETDEVTVTMCIWQFPLIALGMAALLVCALSPRSLLSRKKIPGAAFIASVAYSAYLIQKLVIHFVVQFCSAHNITLTSAPALLGIQLCIFAAATVLFLAVERPFLQLRHRLAPRNLGTSLPDSRISL